MIKTKDKTLEEAQQEADARLKVMSRYLTEGQVTGAGGRFKVKLYPSLYPPRPLSLFRPY